MSHDSQRLKILRWLSQGHTLTTWLAIQKWRCTTASQRVTEIKKHWPVQSRKVSDGKSRFTEWWIPAAKAERVRRMLDAA